MAKSPLTNGRLRGNRSRGIFSITLSVSNIGSRPRFVEVSAILVDTGSEATWIGGDTLR